MAYPSDPAKQYDLIRERQLDRLRKLISTAEHALTVLENEGADLRGLPVCPSLRTSTLTAETAAVARLESQREICWSLLAGEGLYSDGKD